MKSAMTTLRSLLFMLYFVALTFAMGLGAIPVRISRRGDWALSYAKLWARLVLRGLSGICAIRIDVTGEEHLPAGPCLVASQHQSFFDGFIWMLLAPRPAYVIKQELLKIPLVGPMLSLSGMIPVHREAGAKALRTLMSATRAAFDGDRQVILFPEGTRTLPGAPVALQPGIVALTRQSPVPVIPVATDSGRCWPRKGIMKHPGTIHVAIGAPLAPSEGRQAITLALSTAWAELATFNARETAQS